MLKTFLILFIFWFFPETSIAVTKTHLKQEGVFLIEKEPQFNFLSAELAYSDVAYGSPLKASYDKGICKIFINKDEHSIGFKVLKSLISAQNGVDRPLLIQSLIVHELAHCYRQKMELIALARINSEKEHWKLYEHFKHNSQTLSEELFADILAIYYVESKIRKKSLETRNFYTSLRELSGDFLMKKDPVSYKALPYCRPEKTIFMCTEEAFWKLK